jgi:hypothetical protein
MLVQSLKILLTADSTQAEKAFKKAKSDVKEFGDQVGKVANKLAFASAAVAAFGTVMVREAAKYDRNVRGALDGLGNAHAHLAVEIGRALLPVVKLLTQAVTGLVAAWRSLSPETQSFVTNFAIAATLLATVAAGILAVVSAAGALAPILLPIAPILLGVVAALGAIWVAAAVLREAWDSNWGGMRDKVRSVLDELDKAWETHASGVKSVFKSVGDFVVKAILWPLRALLMGLDSIKHLLPESWGGTIEAALDTVKDMQARGFDGVVADAKIGFGKISEVVSKGSAKNTASIKAWGKSLINGFGKLKLPKLTTLDDLAKQSEEQLQRNRQAWKTILEEYEKFLDKLADIDRRRGEIYARDARDPVKRLGRDMTPATAERGNPSKQGPAGYAAQQFGQGMLGKASGVTGDVIQGAMMGGIGGAAAALLSNSKSFERVLEIANGVLQRVADLFGLLLEPLRPLIAALMNVVAALSSALVPAFEMIGQLVRPLVPILYVLGRILQGFAPVIALLLKAFLMISSPLSFLATMVLPPLFRVLRFVGETALRFARFIAEIWNGIVGTIAQVFRTIANFEVFGIKPFEFMNSFASGVEGMLIPIGEMTAAIDTLKTMTFESAMAGAEAMADQFNAQNDVTDAIDKTTESMEKFNEALTNVPAGFKVALARFEAGGAVPNINDMVAGGGTTVNVYGNVYGVSDLVRLMDGEKRKQAFQQSGSRLGGG